MTPPLAKVVEGKSMIDMATETVVTLTQARNHLPRRRGGKKPHPSTLYRWAKDGLETIRVGGTLCTSVQALQRYCERLTTRDRPEVSARRDVPKATQMPKEDVQARLDEIGI